jgi:hypothetical protein
MKENSKTLIYGFQSFRHNRYRKTKCLVMWYMIRVVLYRGRFRNEKHIYNLPHIYFMKPRYTGSEML